MRSAKRRFGGRIPGVAIAAIAVIAVAAPYSVSDDLPNPSAHFATVPAGSLVIPMGNTLQAIGSPFNIKAYGLVNRLLQTGIPVKWAIKAGKAKDAVDFSATARQVRPTAGAAANFDFTGGPFVVHRDYAQLALAQAASFGGNVAIYQLTAPATIDERYNLTFKPNIAVGSVNSNIHTQLFDAANIPNYTTVNVSSTPSQVDANSCYTLVTEPHTDSSSVVAQVKQYVLSGGNFLAECQSIAVYENNPAGLLQTTTGYAITNDNFPIGYPNPDLAFSQFIGAFAPTGGSPVGDFALGVGSTFINNTHVHANDIATSPAAYVATAAKLVNGPGGMVFYLGGHNYGAGGSSLSDLNGQRMILNTVFVPSVKCNADFSAFLKTISGTIYEDVNGDGSMADGAVRPNVNVRLYADVNGNNVVDAGDTFLVEAPTDASGAYSFQVSTLASGTRYLIAVDSKSVTPSAGLNAGFTQGDIWAQQTYGTNPATAALDLGPRFGGRNGDVSDNYNVADTTPANNVYQHIANLTVGSSNISNVDFGFSFNVVTGVRGSGTNDDDPTANRTVQGSFRQFLQNANAIAGANPMRFVPAVPANAGLWWRVGINVALPAISDGGTTIDGQAYSATDGTTVLSQNPGTVGAGGTVGVGALALTPLNKPAFEIQNVRSTAVVNVGLDLQASAAAIRRLAIFGFGSAANSDSSANIRVGASGSSSVIEQNIIGSGAGGFVDPGAAARSVGDDVRVVGGTTATIQNNVIGFSGGNGIALSTNATGAQILSNEIRGNGLTNALLSGINVGSGSAGTVQGNLLVANSGAGAETAIGAGASTIVNNTFTGNGAGAGGVSAGVRLLGSSTTFDRNIITANAGAGVLVGASGAQNTLTKNSIFQNGGIGIDLLAAADNQATGTAPFVTLNDSGDPDVGGNDLLNFPVITSAAISEGNLVLQGFARPGSTIELFLADPDPTKFGQGKTYLATVTEGSASDTESGTGSYTSPVNGINQGTDTTNKFTFKIPTPPGVAVGSVLTATATLNGSTSEFGGNLTVVFGGTLSGFVYEDANLNLQRDASEVGTGLTLFVKLVKDSTPAGPAIAVAVVDPATGAYSLANVAPGIYRLILDDNNTLSDVTPATPTGWTGVESVGGFRTVIAVAGIEVPNQNFGLYHGLLIGGRVFADNGAGGGTANDGTLNGSEAGIDAATIKLTDASGATVYSTTTSSGSGAYALPIPFGIAAGTQLKIVETNAPTYLSTGATPGDTGGSYDRNTDTVTFTLAANTSYNNVNFGDVLPVTLTTDGQQAGLPGTTLYYAHTFTAQSAGTVTFSTASIQTPALAGWSAKLYRDVNSNAQLDPAEPAITAPIAVNAGDTVAVIIKEFIPTNAPLGAQDQTTLTANFVYSGAAPALSATPLTRQDETTVGNPTTAGLTLKKQVNKPSALPGDTITYTVTYTNTSSDILRNVIIYDTTPAFTKFTSGTNGPLPLDLTAVALAAPAPGARGAMKWTFTGTLRPGGTGTVSFSVQLDQ
ncbi:MAG: beta strand repeat-containing protein [Chthoniobacterales bacterium]